MKPKSKTKTPQPLDALSLPQVSLQLFNEENGNPHWLVCDHGEPVAKISREHLPHVSGEVFMSDPFAQAIVEQISAGANLTRILQAWNAVFYVFAEEPSI